MWRGKDSNLRSRLATDLQSVPFDHSGTPPENQKASGSNEFAGKPLSPAFTHASWRRDSNPRPADYKSAALPTELRQRNQLTTGIPASTQTSRNPEGHGAADGATRDPGHSCFECQSKASYASKPQSSRRKNRGQAHWRDRPTPEEISGRPPATFRVHAEPSRTAQAARHPAGRFGGWPAIRVIGRPELPRSTTRRPWHCAALGQAHNGRCAPACPRSPPPRRPPTWGADSSR